MKVLLDDTAYYIDIDRVEYKMLNWYEFHDGVKILLTDNQYKKYVEVDTFRTIVVSEKRVIKFTDYFKCNKWKPEKKKG